MQVINFTDNLVKRSWFFFKHSSKFIKKSHLKLSCNNFKIENLSRIFKCRGGGRMLEGKSKGECPMPVAMGSQSHVAREKLNGGYWRGSITELNCTEVTQAADRFGPHGWLVGWPCRVDHPSRPAVIFSTSSNNSARLDIWQTKMNRPVPLVMLWCFRFVTGISCSNY